jgi:iron complex transport system substrate-binding protein
LACLALACITCTGSVLADEVRLKQADGSELVLPAPAETLITLAPNLTELVFAAGAGEKIIATVEYSEFPAPATRIPRIGDAFRLDLERILTLQPDLVIAWHSGNPQAAVAYLKSLGIATWTVEINSPEEMATVLEDLGRASGNPGTARTAADGVRARARELVQGYAGLPAVSYFYQVAENPLYTISGDHLISRSLALCGGRNVFSDAGGLAPTVTREAVIAADPQVLLAPAEPVGQDPLAGWRDWPRMQAVSNGAMFLLPADAISRATPRLMEAVAYGCELMHQKRLVKADP